MGSKRRFADATGGNIAILVAAGSMMLAGVGALGIDYGVAVQTKRKAQGAADVAAMVAAIDITNATAIANRSLADNGYAATQATVTTGTYDATAPLGSRFTAAAAATGNAVKVKLTATAPTTFARLFGLPSSESVSVTATAATAQFAAFSIGSGLAALDGGVANAILGALLGTKLTLGVMDYNALLTTRVDGLRVLDALGASLGLQAGSYTQILQANASIGQILMALRVGAGGNSAAVSALTGILNALPNAGNLVPISRLDSLADAATLAPGKSLAGPQVQLMGLVSAAAAIANGQNQVAIDLGAAIPGLLSTKLTVAIGERKRSSGWVRPGSPNATVQTAQMRLLLETTITAPLNLGSIYLPLVVSAASATGTLRSVTCSSSVPGGRQVVIDGQTGIATLGIAQIAKTAINTSSTGPDLSQPATLISLPLVRVTGRAVANLGTGSGSLTFSDSDITAHTVKTVSSGAIAQSLTSSLISSLSLSVDGLILGDLLKPALQLTLGTVSPVLDLVLDTTLKTLGLRLGIADIDVDGVMCGQAVLVQ